MEPDGHNKIDFQEGTAKVETSRALGIIRGLLPEIGSPEDLELRRDAESELNRTDITQDQGSKQNIEDSANSSS